MSDTTIILDATSFKASTHNGMVTIRNRETGAHRTFKLSTCRAGKLEGKRIVSLLTGPDRADFSNWTGFAFVADNGAVNVWGRFKGTDYAKFATMLQFPERFASRADYLVESACRRCNRPLTHPDSIEGGLGPWCAKQGDEEDSDDDYDDFGAHSMPTYTGGRNSY